VSAIRCILFDLGGVLVRFRGVERVAELVGDAEVGETHWRQWLASPAVRAFELGKLSPEEFAETFLEEFGLGLSPDELLRELHGFVSGPIDGAVELLDELRPHYRVACLSNTNRLHWPPLYIEMELDRRLHHAFPSYETGLLKPDPEAFENVCRELELAPNKILFFDDAPPNIEAAKALGLAVCRARGPADCRRELERRGLLPAC
jgi:putative hydrolase of the HAD superfamily